MTIKNISNHRHCEPPHGGEAIQSRGATALDCFAAKGRLAMTTLGCNLAMTAFVTSIGDQTTHQF